MRPFDPRLLRYARSARAHLTLSVVLGLLTTGLVLAQAFVLAALLSAVITDDAGRSDLRGRLTLLVGVVVARAAVAWGQEVASARGVARVKSELRLAVVSKAMDLGPEWLAARRSSDLALLTTEGLDALDGYLGRYLPQLVLSATLPLAVLVALLRLDVAAAVIVLVTLPLIPILMIVIGNATQRRTNRQWAALSGLAGHFLDAVTGLPTLKVFGRGRAEVAEVGRVSEAYRIATLAQLRLAFLSSLALELIALVGVAVVAVTVGHRLLDGGIELRSGLAILLLVPEAYLPLRQVGGLFHASAEGMSAADRAFAVLEEPAPAAGGRTDVPAPATLRCTGLVVSRPDRDGPVLVVDELLVPAGEVTALVGPSGVGKSTLLAVLMGYVRPGDGRVLIGDVDLQDLDPAAWRRQVAWLGQRPHVLPGSVRDAVLLGDPAADDSAVLLAAQRAGALDLLDRSVGEGGVGLSAGERQRVALARLFLRDVPVVLLDEPTAHLDAATEAAVIDALRDHLRGRTTLVVAHRPALLALADRVVLLEPATQAEAVR